MDGVSKQGVISFSGKPNPNLFRATSMTTEERAVSGFVENGSTDWTKYFRYYNGGTSSHSFSSDGVDTITLTSGSNVGISFQRKATDIDLDSTSWYMISCEAKCEVSGAHLDIGLSYYTTSDTWVWNGGTNPQNFNAVDTWQKFTLKFKPASNTQYIMYCFTVNSTTGKHFSIRHCKLEKGEIPTAWIPNENDVDFVSNICGFIEDGTDNICKIQKNGYIQANEFIEF